MELINPQPFPRGRPVKYQWAELEVGKVLKVRLNGTPLAIQKSALYSSAKNAGVKISVSCIAEVGFLHAKILRRQSRDLENFCGEK
jgi:hypothetical protein